MSVDRQIKWKEPPEHGPPTIEQVQQVAKDFLGEGWEVRAGNGANGKPCWIYCHTKQKMTYPLISQQEDWDWAQSQAKFYSERTRGFYVFFSGEHGKDQTAVCTSMADEFSSALADQFAKLIARWWNGEVRWPT